MLFLNIIRIVQLQQKLMSFRFRNKMSETYHQNRK